MLPHLFVLDVEYSRTSCCERFEQRTFSNNLTGTFKQLKLKMWLHNSFIILLLYFLATVIAETDPAKTEESNLEVEKNKFFEEVKNSEEQKKNEDKQVSTDTELELADEIDEEGEGLNENIHEQDKKFKRGKKRRNGSSRKKRRRKRRSSGGGGGRRRSIGEGGRRRSSGGGGRRRSIGEGGGRRRSIGEGARRRSIGGGGSERRRSSGSVSRRRRSTTNPPGPGGNSGIEGACLRAHNAKRALHQSTPPLNWDATLAQHAQAWADHLARTGKFEHAKGTGEGENLYMSWGSGSSDAESCSSATGSWYDEIKYYNYNNPGFSMKTGHFTQVVWKSTTKLGCGVRTHNGKTYVVARYLPPGNYNNLYRQNVMREKNMG